MTMNSQHDENALSISLFQHQGAREAQEDAYCVAPIYPGHLLAVFDGHCGAQVAQTAALRLPGLFANHLDRLGVRHAGEALRLTLQDLIALCANGCPQKGHLPPAGATVTAAFVAPSPDGCHYDVVAGVLGDSPLFALCPDHPHGRVIGPEHSVATSPEDVTRIRQSHAEAMQDGRLHITPHYLETWTNYLAPTRSLGDPDFGEFLIQEPEMLAFRVLRGDPLLLATDGIHDYSGDTQVRHMHYERLLRIARNGLHAREVGFQTLMEMERRTVREHRDFQPDNLTLLIVR